MRRVIFRCAVIGTWDCAGGARASPLGWLAGPRTCPAAREPDASKGTDARVEGHFVRDYVEWIACHSNCNYFFLHQTQRNLATDIVRYGVPSASNTICMRVAGALRTAAARCGGTSSPPPSVDRTPSPPEYPPGVLFSAFHTYSSEPGSLSLRDCSTADLSVHKQKKAITAARVQQGTFGTGRLCHARRTHARRRAAG